MVAVSGFFIETMSPHSFKNWRGFNVMDTKVKPSVSRQGAFQTDRYMDSWWCAVCHNSGNTPSCLFIAVKYKYSILSIIIEKHLCCIFICHFTLVVSGRCTP